MKVYPEDCPPEVYTLPCATPWFFREGAVYVIRGMRLEVYRVRDASILVREQRRDMASLSARTKYLKWHSW